MSIHYLVPDPYVGEELSEESISKAMEHFVREFTNRYPTSGPPLYIGTLDQALAHSLFNPTNVGVYCWQKIF
jgi:hypothetical protein